MTASAHAREWELTAIRGGPQTEVKRQRVAGDCGSRDVTATSGSFERLCKIVRQRDGGALHICILTSYRGRGSRGTGASSAGVPLDAPRLGITASYVVML